MNRTRTVILPGLGSPQSNQYKPVYECLDKELTIRGRVCDCFVYESNGHLSNGEIRGEIALPSVADSVAEVLARDNGPIDVICRSFGCFVGGYVAAHNENIRTRIRRIVFWGAVPYHEMWSLFGDQQRLASRAAEASSKGARLSRMLFTSLVPIETLGEHFRDAEVIIAVGTEDKYSSPDFARYLGQLFTNAGCRRIDVRVIDGAPHEVHSGNVCAEVLHAYSEAVCN